jgi:hypothetical protein
VTLFLQSSELRPPQSPAQHPQASVFPQSPLVRGGGTHSLAGEGLGGPNSDKGTGTVVLKVNMYISGALTFMETVSFLCSFILWSRKKCFNLPKLFLCVGIRLHPRQCGRHLLPLNYYLYFPSSCSFKNRELQYLYRPTSALDGGSHKLHAHHLSEDIKFKIVLLDVEDKRKGTVELCFGTLWMRICTLSHELAGYQKRILLPKIIVSIYKTSYS